MILVGTALTVQFHHVISTVPEMVLVTSTVHASVILVGPAQIAQFPHVPTTVTRR